MHYFGMFATFVPNFSSETLVRGLSVVGLRARVRAAGFFLLLLQARVTIVLGREAGLAHMHAATIASASPVLAVVGGADLPPIWRGGVDKPRPRVCSQASLPGLPFGLGRCLLPPASPPFHFP